MSFSMPVRSKPAHGVLRRRRISWVSREHTGAADQADHTEGAVGQTGPLNGHPAHPGPPRRNLRQGGAPQDRALYSCSCGYAFAAPVSTSVDCPHCGDRQAW
jgi:hypothetical protein